MAMSPSEAEIDALLTASPGAPVYLIGAGGCGMSGLGHLLLDLGHRVSGADLIENEEIRQLRSRGAIVHRGHDAAHIAASDPVLVVFSPAVGETNPELSWARVHGRPAVRRAILLAALFHRQRGIAVSGMHGKTSTAALLAYALKNLSANPSHAIGALVPQLGRHARLAWPNASSPGATPPWFVIEADESDGTLHLLRAEHAIVLNVDVEHLDHFANLDAVCDEFRQFAAQVRGFLVFCADEPRLRTMFGGRANAASYGYHPTAKYRIAGRHLPAREHPTDPFRSAFDVTHRGAPLGTFAIRQLGEKNVSNAAAVVAVLHQLGYAPDVIARAIADFTGAARRQEELFADDLHRVFDDYGHHPAEVRATLRLFKELGAGRLLVVFQPHRYSRTKALLDEFATCFRDADLLWLTEIYAASESPIPGVNGASLADAVRATGQTVAFAPDLDTLSRDVRAALQPGDVVLFLGAGDITQAAHRFANELAKASRTPS